MLSLREPPIEGGKSALIISFLISKCPEITGIVNNCSPLNFNAKHLSEKVYKLYAKFIVDHIGRRLNKMQGKLVRLEFEDYFRNMLNQHKR